MKEWETGCWGVKIVQKTKNEHICIFSSLPFFFCMCIFYSYSPSLLWKLPSGSEAIYGTSEHVLNGTIMRSSVPPWTQFYYSIWCHTGFIPRIFYALWAELKQKIIWTERAVYYGSNGIKHWQIPDRRTSERGGQGEREIKSYTIVYLLL